MKKILQRRLLFPTFIIICFLLSSSGLSSAGSRFPGKAKKLKVDGSISVSVRQAGTTLAVNLYLKADGNPVRGQVVKVENILIRDKKPGYYFKHIKNFQSFPGKIVKVSITPPKLPNLLPGRTYKIEGTATIGKMNRLISPAINSVITLAGSNGVEVRWAQNINNGKCIIVEIIGGNVANYVFEGVVSGRTITIPASIFKPNMKYGIYLSSKIEKFSLTGDYLSSSTLSLRQTPSTYFFTK